VLTGYKVHLVKEHRSHILPTTPNRDTSSVPRHQNTTTTVLPTPRVCVQRHEEERRYCRTLSHWWNRRRKL